MQDAISTKLVEIIKAIEDEDGNPCFGQVLDYDPGNSKFDAWPCVLVLPDTQPADTATNKSNDRHEGFMAYVMLPIGEAVGISEKRQQVYKTMRQLSDRIRNAIDATYDLDGLKANGGADRVLAVEPVSSGWDTVETNAGNTIMLRITITIRYSHMI